VGSGVCGAEVGGQVGNDVGGIYGCCVGGAGPATKDTNKKEGEIIGRYHF